MSFYVPQKVINHFMVSPEQVAHQTHLHNRQFGSHYLVTRFIALAKHLLISDELLN